MHIDHRGKPSLGARIPDDAGIADGDGVVWIGKIDAGIAPELFVSDVQNLVVVPLVVNRKGPVEELHVMVITDGTHGIGGFADGEIVQIESGDGYGSEVLTDNGGRHGRAGQRCQNGGAGRADQFAGVSFSHSPATSNGD